MNFRKILETARKRYEKNAEGLPKKELLWLRQKIEDANPRWAAYDDKDAKEYFVLNGMSDIISKIKSTKPKNIRDFAEMEVRRGGYTQTIDAIRNEIRSTPPKDEEKLGAISRKIEELSSEVKQKDPEFLPVMEKFIAIAVMELSQKREGVNPEKVRFHIR